MKFLIKQKLWTAAWLTFVTLGMQGTAWGDDDDIERIFFFGDSLSDSGNAYIESGKLTTQPPYTLDEIVPTFPYDIRGFQFSNGKTWARIFANALETGRSGKASLKKARRFTNYAYGGARARPFGDRPSAAGQFAEYINDFPGSADEEDLYVIQFGGNDLRDVLAGEGLPEDIISSALQTKAFVITQLYAKGARNFLVANVPDISLSPAVKLQVLQDVGPIAAPVVLKGISDLVKGYNEQLNGTLSLLKMYYPDIKFKQLNFFDILNDVVFNPGKFGISNNVSPCIDYFTLGDQVCGAPDEYVFWDGIHPTAKVHRLVGEIAAELYDDDDDDD